METYNIGKQVYLTDRDLRILSAILISDIEYCLEDIEENEKQELLRRLLKWKR